MVTGRWAATLTARVGLGSQQGSPRGQIWMSATSPPTKTFLSKHRPGSRAARLAEPLPFPQTDESTAPTRACHCPSLEAELRPVPGPQAVAMDTGLPDQLGNSHLGFQGPAPC